MGDFFFISWKIQGGGGRSTEVKEVNPTLSCFSTGSPLMLERFFYQGQVLYYTEVP